MRTAIVLLVMAAASWAGAPDPDLVRVPRADGETQLSRTSSEVVQVNAAGHLRRSRLNAAGVRRPVLAFPAPDTLDATDLAAATATSVTADFTQNVSDTTPRTRRVRNRKRDQGRRGFLADSHRQASPQMSVTRSTHPTARPGFAVRRLGNAVRRPGAATDRPHHPTVRLSHPTGRGGHPVSRPGASVSRPGFSIARSGFVTRRSGHPVQRAGTFVQRSSAPTSRPSMFCRK